jgi:hypothetical protein
MTFPLVGSESLGRILSPPSTLRRWAVAGVGTDHPIPWQAESVDHILKAPGFTAAERRAMLGETAARLLRIKP